MSRWVNLNQARAKASAKALGKTVHGEFPFVDGGGPVAHDLTELILNRTWRPALSVTGIDGMPHVVLR